jgi:hypothetical protein
VLALLLSAVMAAIPLSMTSGVSASTAILAGFAVFGVVFAINSSVHSFLILAYSDGDKAVMNVGFYYMANAGGRLIGTLVSGIMYQVAGLAGCLWASVAFAFIAGAISMLLPNRESTLDISGLKLEGSE